MKDKKTAIHNLIELDQFIKKNCPQIADHEYENDGDLDSYSLSTLETQVHNLIHYINAPNSENYVPEYYGCGLISRVLCYAQENGAYITESFFSQFYGKRDAKRLTKVSWY